MCSFLIIHLDDDHHHAIIITIAFINTIIISQRRGYHVSCEFSHAPRLFCALEWSSTNQAEQGTSFQLTLPAPLGLQQKCWNYVPELLDQSCRRCTEDTGCRVSSWPEDGWSSQVHLIWEHSLSLNYCQPITAWTKQMGAGFGFVPSFMCNFRKKSRFKTLFWPTDRVWLTAIGKAWLKVIRNATKYLA